MINYHQIICCSSNVGVESQVKRSWAGLRPTIKLKALEHSKITPIIKLKALLLGKITTLIIMSDILGGVRISLHILTFVKNSQPKCQYENLLYETAIMEVIN